MLDDYEAVLENQDRKRQIEWNERVDKVQKKMQLMADGVVKTRGNAEREAEIKMMMEEQDKI